MGGTESLAKASSLLIDYSDKRMDNSEQQMSIVFVDCSQEALPFFRIHSPCSTMTSLQPDDGLISPWWIDRQPMLKWPLAASCMSQTTAAPSLRTRPFPLGPTNETYVVASPFTCFHDMLVCFVSMLKTVTHAWVQERVTLATDSIDSAEADCLPFDMDDWPEESGECQKAVRRLARRVVAGRA